MVKIKDGEVLVQGQERPNPTDRVIMTQGECDELWMTFQKYLYFKRSPDHKQKRVLSTSEFDRALADFITTNWNESEIDGLYGDCLPPGLKSNIELFRTKVSSDLLTMEGYGTLRQFVAAIFTNKIEISEPEEIGVQTNEQGLTRITSEEKNKLLSLLSDYAGTPISPEEKIIETQLHARLGRVARALFPDPKDFKEFLDLKKTLPKYVYEGSPLTDDGVDHEQYIIR